MKDIKGPPRYTEQYMHQWDSCRVSARARKMKKNPTKTPRSPHKDIDDD